jgi:hypothetical protein
MPNFYIAIYTPLAATAHGRRASDEGKLPPFIDGSIRREPDLQHRYPSISCICRGRLFAPRLEKGDIVAYVATKRRYREPAPHWRLTAVLEVWKKFDTHELAGAWYRRRGLPLPSNCMVSGNAAERLELSHGICGTDSCRRNKPSLRLWDRGYRLRAEQHPTFLVCRKLFRDLSWKAPTIKDADWGFLFQGERPSRNPRTQSMADWSRFMKRFGLRVPPSAR